MINMLAVVPDPWIAESKVTGTSSDDGVLSDVSVEVRLSDDQKFTVRTLVRLGERIGGAGSLHGTMTDAASVAALAASSLMLRPYPHPSAWPISTSDSVAAAQCMGGRRDSPQDCAIR